MPEVESARVAIERAGLGRRIVEVDDSDRYECRPHLPGEIRAALLGRRLTAAHRRGKSMWCQTSDAGPDLGIHLGMSGRILISGPSSGQGAGEVVEGGDYAGPATGRPALDVWFRFTLAFADGGTLRLLDKRRLGRVRLDPDLSALGPDAQSVDRAEFRARVGKGTAPLKARLLDQSVLAGVGNLLADQALWQSRLAPRRPAGALTATELDRLHDELRAAIDDAVRNGGVHTGSVVAYRKAGRHCPRCGTEMACATVGGRTTWWCPAEQR
nr:DNA-formamidopyrimidine glycosylase family protein [Motilibacter aurantiacus]